MTSGAAQQIPLREDLTHFECWALSMLRCELNANGRDVWKVTLPESLQADWDGKHELHFHAASNGAASDVAASDDADPFNTLEVTPNSKLFQWTIDRLRAQSPLHAAPQSQPAGVHEITPPLFSQFTFEEGHIHLAGCSLEDRPVIRLTLLGEASEDDATLRHHFYWPSGEVVEEALVSQLALDQLQPYDARPPQRLMASLQDAIREATAHFTEQGDDVLAVTVIWCKYAEGKIAFEAADETVHVAFSGWARLFADGSLKPEPYHCPLSDQTTYDLSITDDGRIAAKAGIAACEESGRRMLVSELDCCAATGKRVDAKLIQTCRVSGESVLSSSLVACAQCGQQVSPQAVRGGRCSACRSVASIRKDDPRMARLLDEYPKLDSWPRWRIAETETIYVLLATSWLRQLSIVVDKVSLEVAHIAVSGRLITNWLELTTAQREEFLS